MEARLFALKGDIDSEISVFEIEVDLFAESSKKECSK